MAIDVTKLHFANFFNVFSDTSLMKNGELAFDSTYRLVFKDNSGTVHPIVSVADYNNIYSPSTITITQNVQSATVGVGVEGDYSASVTQSMPLSNVLTATGIHNRLILMYYDSNNNIKDMVRMPEYFCTLGGSADILHLNKGELTDNIKKVKITANLGVTTLTNNNIFKIYLTETTDVATTLNLPLTTEANNDNIANQNQMYIGADNYLYIIKDKSVADLTYPFWFFNRRVTPSIVKVNTTIPLLDKNDIIAFHTYRYVSDNISGTTYQFIGAGETAQITKVIQAIQTNGIGREEVTLGISADKKSVTGLQDGSYYEITVLTDEAPVIPSLQYEILNVQDGFFSYLYGILKNINDNEHQVPIDIGSLEQTIRLELAGDYDAKLALKADLASPALTGTPIAPTAPTDTNTTQIATTSFVLGQAAVAAPLMDGTAVVGVSNKFAREDHTHPSDTSRAPLVSPTFTGTPAAPTPSVDTNTTQIATTSFVLGQAAAVAPLMDGVATIGVSTRFARADHIHPSDTSRAPVISPALTGTPTAPTASVDTNTTQIATTSFVLGQAAAVAPLMDGIATIGVSSRFARADHIHPSDTSRATVASPTFTGIATAPTFAANTVDIKSSSTSSKFTLDYNETENSLDFIYTP